MMCCVLIKQIKYLTQYAYKKHLLQVFMLIHKIVVHNIIFGRKTPLETL